MKRFFFKLRRFLFSWDSWKVADYRYTLVMMERATKALQRSEGLPERGMRIDIDRMVGDYALNQIKEALNKKYGKFGK